VSTRRRIAVLLGGCLFLVALLEAGAIWTSRRLASRRDIRDDVRAAAALAGGRSVLVVGNSLVQHGIDIPAVDGTLGAGHSASKLAIVDTGYLDWLYGIMSLFDRGSQPEAIVLALSPTQLVEDRPPTGSAVRMLWTMPNLIRYAIERRPGLTAVSDRLFEHTSAFFANRTRLRLDARQLIVPGYAAMWRAFFTPVSDAPDTVADQRVAEARLKALADVCARHGVRFVFVLMPTNAPADGALERAVSNAGQRVDVAVLVPVSNQGLDPRWLLDGYHMNAAGASAFSVRVGAALSAELGRQEKQASRLSSSRRP
jgi:hypothetical protein